MHVYELHMHCVFVPQDKYAQKVHFQAAGVPLPEFREIKCRGCMEATVKQFGLPFMLKAKRWGWCVCMLHRTLKHFLVEHFSLCGLGSFCACCCMGLTMG